MMLGLLSRSPAGCARPAELRRNGDVKRPRLRKRKRGPARKPRRASILGRLGPKGRFSAHDGVHRRIVRHRGQVARPTEVFLHHKVAPAAFDRFNHPDSRPERFLCAPAGTSTPRLAAFSPEESRENQVGQGPPEAVIPCRAGERTEKNPGKSLRGPNSKTGYRGSDVVPAKPGLSIFRKRYVSHRKAQEPVSRGSSVPLGASGGRMPRAVPQVKGCALPLFSGVIMTASTMSACAAAVFFGCGSERGLSSGGFPLFFA